MSLYKKGHRNKTHYSGHLTQLIALHAKAAETERTATTKNAAGSTVACLMTALSVKATAG